MASFGNAFLFPTKANNNTPFAGEKHSSGATSSFGINNMPFNGFGSSSDPQFGSTGQNPFSTTGTKTAFFNSPTHPNFGPKETGSYLTTATTNNPFAPNNGAVKSAAAGPFTPMGQSATAGPFSKTYASSQKNVFTAAGGPVRSDPFASHSSSNFNPFAPNSFSAKEKVFEAKNGFNSSNPFAPPKLPSTGFGQEKPNPFVSKKAASFTESNPFAPKGPSNDSNPFLMSTSSSQQNIFTTKSNDPCVSATKAPPFGLFPAESSTAPTSVSCTSSFFAKNESKSSFPGFKDAADPVPKPPENPPVAPIFNHAPSHFSPREPRVSAVAVGTKTDPPAPQVFPAFAKLPNPAAGHSPVPKADLVTAPESPVTYEVGSVVLPSAKEIFASQLAALESKRQQLESSDIALSSLSSSFTGDIPPKVPAPVVIPPEEDSFSTEPVFSYYPKHYRNSSRKSKAKIRPRGFAPSISKSSGTELPCSSNKTSNPAGMLDGPKLKLVL